MSKELMSMPKKDSKTSKIGKFSLGTWVRILLSLSLLAWSIARAGLTEIFGFVSVSRLSLVAISLAIFQIGILMRTFRWKILMEGINISVPYPYLLVLNYSGAFFNTFLPTGFGGDFVKMFEISNATKTRKGTVAGIVLLDRFCGFAALFFLCLMALPFAKIYLPITLFWAVAGIAVVGVLITLIVINSTLLKYLMPYLKYMPKRNSFQQLFQTIIEYPRKRFYQGILISLGIHILLINMHFLISRSINLDLPLILFAIFSPVVSLSLLLPSIQGLGIRENLYGLLISNVGYSESAGVTIGLIIYAINVMTGLIGGLFYLYFTLGVAKNLKLGKRHENEEIAK